MGVLNSDGFISVKKIGQRVRHILTVAVGEKSLPMIEKLQEIFSNEFNRHVKIQFMETNEYGTKIYRIELSLTRLLPLFTNIGIKKGNIPIPIQSDVKLFSAYMGGLIDGDGTVCVKRRKSYPQCVVRIIDGKKSEELKQHIEHFLNCKCWIEPIKKSSYHFPTKNSIVGYRHCFYVSKKNKYIFKKLVLPYIQINHKNKMLNDFVN